MPPSDMNPHRDSLLSRFITDDLLRNMHYAVTFTPIKQSETEMDFAQ